MRVSVELPDPKASALDTALAKQFADIQRQLLRLVEAKDDSSHAMHRMMLKGMEEQQSTLVSALERLMGLVGKASKTPEMSSGLADTLRGLKQTLTELPGDLKDALDQQYQRTQKRMTAGDAPPARVTVKMPSGLLTRIDSLEAALLQGLKRSRSRTFGSNS